MRRIRRLKGRRAPRAIALQVASAREALRFFRPTELLSRIMRAFWPGPLTLVGRPRRGRGKIGIRVPQHALSLKLLRRYRRPLAVTSLNVTGKKELWRTEDILAFTDGRVDVVILETGGRRGRSSTVCDISSGRPKVLRKGPITLKEILDAGRG